MPQFELGNGDVVEYEYIVNANGAVHDVASSHPAVALAKGGKEGWRLATEEEISAYREKHLIGDSEAQSANLAARKVASDKAAAAAMVTEAADEATTKKARAAKPAS
jgi:hypothetical protein